MGQDSKIEWTDHTFNPWRGCTKVSEGCRNCYAETLSGRNPGTLGVWGPNGTRVVAAESAWKEPLKWDRAAKAAGVRARVFCASLADVFEDWRGSMIDARGERLYYPNNSWEDRRPWVPISECGGDEKPITMGDVRKRLFGLICRTPNLDWLVVTKRPENAGWMLGPSGVGLYATEDGPVPRPQPNLWIGASVENQQAADERIPHLLRVPAAVRFLSMEPLLGPVNVRGHVLGFDAGQPARCECGHGHGFTRCPNTGGVSRSCHVGGCSCPGFRRSRGPGLHWIIVGGESGADARTLRTEWVRDILGQCRAAGTPAFVKQLGASVTTRLPDGERWAGGDGLTGHLEFSGDGFGNYHVRGLTGKKGGDPAEWPEDLRVREFPVRPTP